ncbi:MAG: DUF1292 domain-containing protein [Bacilli bacterium]|nr:DUF1292 domain-containing protein [Bacilli bacterium]
MKEDIITNQDPLEIEMESEEGEKVRVRIVRLFEDGDKSYVVADNLDNEEESYIFEIIPHDDGDELVSIETEEEFNRLCEVLNKQLEEEEE